jgi:hypothetical protein
MEDLMSTVTTTLTISSDEQRDFGAELAEAVKVEMHRLTEAGAVDEWHAQILDPFVEELVALESARLRQQLLRERTAWRIDLATAERDHEQAARRAAHAQGILQRAEERLHELEQQHRSLTDAASLSATQPTKVGRCSRALRRFTEWRHRTRPTAESLQLRVEEQRALMASAVTGHEQAQLRFRGADTILEGHPA